MKFSACINLPSIYKRIFWIFIDLLFFFCYSDQVHFFSKRRNTLLSKLILLDSKKKVKSFGLILKKLCDFKKCPNIFVTHCNLLSSFTFCVSSNITIIHIVIRFVSLFYYAAPLWASYFCTVDRKCLWGGKKIFDNKEVNGFFSSPWWKDKLPEFWSLIFSAHCRQQVIRLHSSTVIWTCNIQ